MNSNLTKIKISDLRYFLPPNRIKTELIRQPAGITPRIIFGSMPSVRIKQKRRKISKKTWKKAKIFGWFRQLVRHISPKKLNKIHKKGLKCRENSNNGCNSDRLMPGQLSEITDNLFTGLPGRNSPNSSYNLSFFLSEKIFYMGFSPHWP